MRSDLSGARLRSSEADEQAAGAEGGIGAQIKTT